MDFAICLDQFSTNFNVSSLSPNGFSIYTDLDYNNPIASGIPYQDLFAPPIGNCPLIVNVPQGATQILVIDACTTLPTNVAPIFNAGNSANSLITQCCYAIIQVPVEPISWCDTADLNFDIFSASFIGQIIAGNLTSTLGTVTDYTIGWYKDGDYSAPEFISGYGNAFVPYQLTHPLAGNTAPYVTAGDWEGIIHDIAINGTTYSSVSGSANGTPIPFESCFGTIVVAPLQCDNGTFPLPYTHQKSFTAVGNGATPPVIGVTYQLDSSTNYFAYKFFGYSVYDELEIKFISGDPNNTGNPSLYNQPIYLEKAQIGSDIPLSNISTLSEINDNNYPKKIKNSFYKRVLTLTNISRSANPSLPDTLDIKITPNPTNNQTSWELQMQCLDTFDCSDCINPYPPVTISEILLNYYCCGNRNTTLILTGSCGSSPQLWDNKLVSLNPYIQSSSYVISDSWVSKYFPPLPESQAYQLTFSNFNANTPSACIAAPINNITPSCAPVTPNSVISYHKSVTTVNGQSQGIISMSFNNSTDYLHYKNQIEDFENSLIGITSIGPIVYDPTNIKSYDYYLITLPTSNIICGDGVPFQTYKVSRRNYPNITYVENPANNYWSITIPMVTLLNEIPQTNCSNCYSQANNAITQINPSSANINNNISVTNVYGSKLNNFIFAVCHYTSSQFTETSVCRNASPERSLSLYSFNTLPFVSSVSSPTGWVNLPSLGASPCPSVTSSMPIIATTSPNYQNTGVWRYSRELGYTFYFPDVVNSPNDFELYTVVTSSNGSNLNPWVCPPQGYKIFEYSSSISTVYTSSYFLNGNTPPVTINPPAFPC
jgi:hypothetical protein